MPVQPYSHSVSPIEVNNYHHLKEVSRENCEDGQGRKWTKITYEHSSMWQIGMGFAAFFSTLAVLIVGVFFIEKIQNLWRNALTGREIVVVNDKNPIEKNVDQVFHQKNPHIKKDQQEISINQKETINQELQDNKNHLEVLADNKESIIQDLPVKSEEISKEQLQARDFKKNPLTQDQFDALFPPLEWPEDSRIQELSEEQLYDCLPLFDAARMFLLSNQQIENFDFGHPNFQNHPHKSDLIDKGLFKYQIPLGHPDSFLIERGFDKRILTNYRNRMQLIRESQINHIIPYVSITMIEYITLPQFKMLDFKKLKKDQLDELFFKEFSGANKPERLNALSESQVRAQSSYFNQIGGYSFARFMEQEKADQFIQWYVDQENEKFYKNHPNYDKS